MNGPETSKFVSFFEKFFIAFCCSLNYIVIRLEKLTVWDLSFRLFDLNIEFVLDPKLLSLFPVRIV